ncbi:MAG: hypothetical protein NC548_22160 [Lachnospiraceae bacterium]|nr:hypothetical protein [Lachnospiraceae bacterium]
MQEVKWKIGETYETERPADIEKGADRVKVRRNITRETRTTENGKRKVWVYEYANMTLAQYDTYKTQLAELESPLAQLIAENNTQQMEGTAAIYEEMLEIRDTQQAIMEGIAAVYEMGVNAE